MSGRPRHGPLRLGVALPLIALACASVYGQLPGLFGMMMGLGGAAFGVMALLLLVQWVGAAAAKGASRPFGTLVVMLAFLAKLPVYFGLWQLSQRIGDPAPACFLSGVVLVYFAVVAWAMTR